MLGLQTSLVDHLDVPFPCYGATALADQAQVDPWEVLVALVNQLRAHGGTVHEPGNTSDADVEGAGCRSTCR